MNWEAQKKEMQGKRVVRSLKRRRVKKWKKKLSICKSNRKGTELSIERKLVREKVGEAER